MSTSAPVAVVGATGQQGSATVDALLDRGIPVRALTRNTDGAAARALAERGVDVVAADLEVPDSLRPAFEGVLAAFAMTTFGASRSPNGSGNDSVRPRNSLNCRLRRWETTTTAGQCLIGSPNCRRIAPTLTAPVNSFLI